MSVHSGERCSAEELRPEPDPSGARLQNLAFPADGEQFREIRLQLQLIRNRIQICCSWPSGIKRYCARRHPPRGFFFGALVTVFSGDAPGGAGGAGGHPWKWRSHGGAGLVLFEVVTAPIAMGGFDLVSAAVPGRDRRPVAVSKSRAN